MLNLHRRRLLLLIGSEEGRPERHFRRKEAREIRLEGARLPLSLAGSRHCASPGQVSPSSASGEELGGEVLGEQGPKTPNETLNVVLSETQCILCCFFRSQSLLEKGGYERNRVRRSIILI